MLPPARPGVVVPPGRVPRHVSVLAGRLPAACRPGALRRSDIFLQENAPPDPEPACTTLTIDRVTGLLASDACPADVVPGMAARRAPELHATCRIGR